jgi:hypothetical protein
MMLRLLGRVTHPLRLERERALCGESCTSARPRGLLRAAGLLRACSKEEGGIHIDGSGISAACFTASAKMCRLTRLRSARAVAMHESVLARLRRHRLCDHANRSSRYARTTHESTHERDYRSPRLVLGADLGRLPSAATRSDVQRSRRAGDSCTQQVAQQERVRCTCATVLHAWPRSSMGSMGIVGGVVHARLRPVSWVGGVCVHASCVRCCTCICASSCVRAREITHVHTQARGVRVRVCG